jgi:hypothetical protein
MPKIDMAAVPGGVARVLPRMNGHMEWTAPITRSSAPMAGAERGLSLDVLVDYHPDAMPFTRDDVIRHLEGCYHEPYRWFVNLEHPYHFNATAGLHLYADADRWAMVFETVVFGDRAMRIELMVSSFANCLVGLAREGLDDRYESNTDIHTLITQRELLRVLRDQDLVPFPVGAVTVRDQQLPGPDGPGDLAGLGIVASADGVSIEGLMRYLAARHPGPFRAREEELRAHIPNDLSRLLTLSDWHHRSFGVYEGRVVGEPPGSYETYPMLAAVLEARDPALYRPTLPPNTHWSNWPDAGQL